jgi:hypothetical protein
MAAHAMTALTLASFAAACDVGEPAAPAFVAGAVGEAGAPDATITDAGASYAICPPDIDASFGSLVTTMFVTTGCGTNKTNNCHSASGASMRGTGNGLDFTVDAAAIYAQLLGDGGGAPSTNLSGSAHVLRVVPGDASASMLYIKLQLTSPADPQYGAGMPLDTPGSVCPAALAAVRDWINGGATP